MTEPTAKTPSGRGLKIALAVSLALNLAVAGLVAGAWPSDHGPRRDMPRVLRAVERDRGDRPIARDGDEVHPPRPQLAGAGANSPACS